MKIFVIICIAMLVIGVIANVLSWILERRYKNKMNSMSNDIKLGK